jgi:ComF family protein
VDLICAACRREVVTPKPPLCRRCGIPLGSPDALSVCRRCRVEPPPYAVARSAALYRGRLRGAIHRFKFEARQEIGPILGQLLADFVRATPPLTAAEIILPVPLHARRLRERGFNQASLLAGKVAEALRLPMVEGALQRTAPTLPQASLGRAERYTNVRGAFSLDPRRGPLLRSCSVLLVDDVMTSGATATSCAQALLAGGAAEVRVATLARAILDEPPRNEGGAAG